MNVFDLFEYDDDPENEGVEKLRFHLKRNRFKSLEKPKLHKHSHSLGEQDVEETASMTKGMKSNHEAFKMQEARKPDVNFDIEDIKRLEQIKDLATLKTQAMALIAKPSAKPMRPEKVEWFRSALERMDSPMKVIKLMYDLMLSGEGHQVIGSRGSMNPNSYRSRFGEQDIKEVSNKLLDRYKKAAGADASAADKRGDIEHGNKRFKGIIKATIKQGENDAKKHKGRDVAEGSEDDIEDTRQFRNAIALAKSQKAIRQAKDGKDAKHYADGTKVTPDEVARRAAERKAKKQGVAEGNEPRFLDDDFYAYDPETKEIKGTWSHKSVGRRHSEHRAQQQGLTVVSGMRAKSLGLHYPNRGVDENFEKKDVDAAMQDFLARGGEVKKGKTHKPRSSEKTDFGSRHIGGRGEIGRGKGTRIGKAAKTDPGGKPVVTVEELSEAMEEYLYELELAGYDIVNEGRMQCPECGGTAYADQMLAEKKDACYSKVKSRYKVWPSAYASGALTRCRKVGAANWGNKSKK